MTEADGDYSDATIKIRKEIREIEEILAMVHEFKSPNTGQTDAERLMKKNLKRLENLLKAVKIAKICKEINDAKEVLNDLDD